MTDAAQIDTPEQAEFRQYCRDWLADNTPGEPPVRLPLSPLEIMTPEQMASVDAWSRIFGGVLDGFGLLSFGQATGGRATMDTRIERP